MDQKVIALTGGGSGIGRATAKLLALRGAKLSIADKNPEALAQLSAEFAQHPEFLFTELDISNVDQVDAWVRKTVKHFGRLDGAANCAGATGKTTDYMPLTEVDDDHWHTAIAVNLTGMFAHFSPLIR